MTRRSDSVASRNWPIGLRGGSYVFATNQVARTASNQANLVETASRKLEALPVRAREPQGRSCTTPVVMRRHSDQLCVIDTSRRSYPIVSAGASAHGSPMAFCLMPVRERLLIDAGLAGDYPGESPEWAAALPRKSTRGPSHRKWLACPEAGGSRTSQVRPCES